METQEELWARYEQLKVEERWDEALKLLEVIEPVSDEEWLKVWDNAPEVDEQLPDFVRERVASFEAAQRSGGRRAG